MNKALKMKFHQPRPAKLRPLRPAITIIWLTLICCLPITICVFGRRLGRHRGGRNGVYLVNVFFHVAWGSSRSPASFLVVKQHIDILRPLRIVVVIQSIGQHSPTPRPGLQFGPIMAVILNVKPIVNGLLLWRHREWANFAVKVRLLCRHLISEVCRHDLAAAFGQYM